MSNDLFADTEEEFIQPEAGEAWERWTAVLNEASLGRDPKVFGPVVWKYFHMEMAYMLPAGPPGTPKWDEQQRAIKFVHEVRDRLRCASCRHHMRLYLREHPITAAVDSREAYFAWGWNFHNAVNLRLNKPIFSWGEAVAQYCQREDRDDENRTEAAEASRRGDPDQRTRDLQWCVLGLLLGLLVFSLVGAWRHSSSRRPS